MLQNNAALKSKIDALWNTFWSGGISNPLSAIEQITYLLFMKRLDEMETKRERDAEFTGETYTSRFNGTYLPYVDESILGFRSSPDKSKEEVEAIENEIQKMKVPRDRTELRWSFFKTMAPADKMLEHV